MAKFKIGDVVCLKSVNLELTVCAVGLLNRLDGTNDNVEVAWFDGTKFQREIFHEDALQAN
jgi:uncharacterized protein YodC (DUF2158 family)